MCSTEVPAVAVVPQSVLQQRQLLSDSPLLSVFPQDAAANEAVVVSKGVTGGVGKEICCWTGRRRRAMPPNSVTLKTNSTIFFSKVFAT